MFVKDYLSVFLESINEYSLSGCVMTSEIVSDFRSDKIGLIRGKIVFIDDSALFFKEYLDLRYKIDKKAYSFHYQDKDSNLLFRYDNALHKPSLEFNDHKHIGDTIIESEVPNISSILEEIANEYISL